MPYELRGNKVVKSSTGEVVKDHGSDHAKAVKHLRALKANVEEAAPLVLGALLEGFDERSHPRGRHGRFIATLHHPVLGTITHAVTASSSQEAWDAARRAHPGASVQSVAPHDAAAREVLRSASGRKFPSLPAGSPPASVSSLLALTGEKAPAFDPVSALGREGTAARERGASSMASEHADTRDKLTSLPMGQSYGLHGPHGQIGRVDRTAKGWEVHAGDTQPKVHKTPSSAAGHAMRLQRQAAATRTDVTARNYRGAQEVSAMNARQSQRAEAEAERQLEIKARTASSSRERSVAQTELERRRGARTARPRVREAAPAVLGALLEGEHERVQEAIGSVDKGAFHRWLGKKEDEPITQADIERGLKAGGKPAKMAAFAKASKKWGK